MWQSNGLLIRGSLVRSQLGESISRIYARLAVHPVHRIPADLCLSAEILLKCFPWPWRELGESGRVETSVDALDHAAFGVGPPRGGPMRGGTRRAPPRPPGAGPGRSGAAAGLPFRARRAGGPAPGF